MNATTTLDTYGKLIAPDALTIERLLPGPIERVWAYLTESDKRRQWLAAGDMVLEPGAEFTLTWRHDELSTPAGTPPEGMGGEHSATCRITSVEPPHRLAYEWPGVGEVEYELTEEGDKVRLTLTHSRTPNRKTTVGVSAGWHAHLDVLVARLEGRAPAPFWDGLTALRSVYDSRIPN